MLYIMHNLSFYLFIFFYFVILRNLFFFLEKTCEILICVLMDSLILQFSHSLHCFSFLFFQKLMDIGVERLVLPAVPSVLNTWTTAFGFSKMTASERLHFLDYTFLDFQDTLMCQKLLTNIPSPKLSPLKGKLNAY